MKRGLVFWNKRQLFLLLKHGIFTSILFISPWSLSGEFFECGNLSTEFAALAGVSTSPRKNPSG